MERPAVVLVPSLAVRPVRLRRALPPRPLDTLRAGGLGAGPSTGSGRAGALATPLGNRRLATGTAGYPGRLHEPGDTRRLLGAGIDEAEEGGRKTTTGTTHVVALEQRQAEREARLQVLEAESPRAESWRATVVGVLACTAEIRRGEPERARVALHQAVADGIATPCGRATYRLELRVVPLGMLSEIA